MELWETHCHTSQVSGCARSTAEEMVEAYLQAGYAGMVVTDHFEPGTIARRCPYRDWERRVEWYLSGYRAALRAAGSRLKVLWGLELRFTENMNDYLVYGMTARQLLNAAKEGLLHWGLERFRQYADENGILVFAAHPFRFSMTINRPELVDGIEVYNGNPSHDSHNALAMWWAERYELLKISGSDAHTADFAARGGIVVHDEITTMADFCRVVSKQETNLMYESKAHDRH